MPPLTLADLTAEQCRNQLARDGLTLRLEPFSVHLRSPYREVAEGLVRLYPERQLDTAGFADFHVSVRPTSLPRRFLRRQCRFSLDGEQPFKPLPADQAFAVFEWGLNWAIANRAHDYLIVHAAVLAWGDHALALPGPPGSGKTTLAAALMLNGWRLLSDELMLMDIHAMTLRPLARPMNLKNDSIGLVRGLGGLTFGAEVSRTLKGRVCHAAANEQSLAARDRPARLRWLLRPVLTPGLVRPRLKLRTRAEGFMTLLRNSFNATVLGERAFDMLAEAMDHTDVYDFEYCELGEAVEFLDRELAGAV